MGVSLPAALVSVAAAGTPVEYRLTCSDAGLVRVEITLPDLPAPQELVVPRAVPMGYGEQPYDRFVSNVAALSPDGRPLAVERAEGPRWRFAGPGAARRVTYEVDVARMEKEILASSDTSRVRPGYVSLLGYSVFAYVDGREDDPVRLEVHGPDGWPVFLTLAPKAPPTAGPSRAEAADFYALADSQIVLGTAASVRVVPGTPPLHVVVYQEAEVDADLLARLGREAIDAMVDYFGSAPFPRYTLLFEFLRPVTPEHRYGFGMEHLESATFTADPTFLLARGASDRDRQRWLYHLTHHVAHAWIPKRCSGEGYFPFTWELAPVLDTIWFSEGFAQYAAISALAARRDDGAAYRERLLDVRFRQSLKDAPPFLRRMSTVQLSRLASTRYAEDFRTGRGSFSRGGLMAAEMDDLIRERTGGAKSLRDALRHLVAWSRENRRPFRLEDLPDLLRAGAGVDVRAVTEKWLAPQP